MVLVVDYRLDRPRHRVISMVTHRWADRLQSHRPMEVQHRRNGMHAAVHSMISIMQAPIPDIVCRRPAHHLHRTCRLHHLRPRHHQLCQAMVVHRRITTQWSQLTTLLLLHLGHSRTRSIHHHNLHHQCRCMVQLRHHGNTLHHRHHRPIQIIIHLAFKLFLDGLIRTILPRKMC